jgi:hypothetical protein
MIVVSDASPLAALSFIRQIDILRELYGIVMVPEAVWREVAVVGADRPGRDAVLRANWIERRAVQNRQLVVALLQDLDAGEAEAIALAVEAGADLLLMDERLGRQKAQYFGLNVIGVIGMLIEAKRRGIIVTVKPHIDQLRDVAGFRISDRLYRRILADQKEGRSVDK